MRAVKEENTLLKSNEAQLQMELHIVKEERERFRKNTRALQQVNTTLEKDMKAVRISRFEIINHVWCWFVRLTQRCASL